MTKVAFNLISLTNAARADASNVEAFTMLHNDILSWHAAGVYPTVADMRKAIRKGYDAIRAVSVSDETVNDYASAVLKWARAGKVPTKMGWKAFQAAVPGAKSGRGRKPKPTMTATTTAPVEGAIDTSPSIGGFLQTLRQMNAKVNTIGLHADEASKVQDALLHCIALLSAAKTAADKVAK